MNRILIVEDRPEYRAGALAYFTRHPDVNTSFASDYESGLAALRERPDGAIIDCFFPDKTGSGDRSHSAEVLIEIFAHHGTYRGNFHMEKEMERSIEEDEANQPLGILLACEAEREKIPFILATSTYHHGYLTQSLSLYVRDRRREEEERGIPRENTVWSDLVDCGQGGESTNNKDGPAFWERAYKRLLQAGTAASRLRAETTPPQTTA